MSDNKITWRSSLVFAPIILLNIFGSLFVIYRCNVDIVSMSLTYWCECCLMRCCVCRWRVVSVLAVCLQSSMTLTTHRCLYVSSTWGHRRPPATTCITLAKTATCRLSTAPVSSRYELHLSINQSIMSLLTYDKTHMLTKYVLVRVFKKNAN